MNHVVQNATPNVKASPGRPPQFDAQQVVSDAVTVFWRNGYEATSLADLESELGINRSTLYGSFGGKAGLYRTAVASYVETMETRLVAPLLSGTRGIADLLAFIERLRELLTDRTHPDGCLIVNAMGSAHPPEAMRQYLANLHAGFDATLRRAVELGEIPEAQCAANASSILISAIGLNVAAKAGITGRELDDLIDGVSSVVNNWTE